MHKRNNKLFPSLFINENRKRSLLPRFNTGQRHTTPTALGESPRPLPHLASPSTSSKLTRPLHNCCSRAAATIPRRSISSSLRRRLARPPAHGLGLEPGQHGHRPSRRRPLHRRRAQPAGVPPAPARRQVLAQVGLPDGEVPGEVRRAADVLPAQGQGAGAHQGLVGVRGVRRRGPRRLPQGAQLHLGRPRRRRQVLQVRLVLTSPRSLAISFPADWW